MILIVAASDDDHVAAVAPVLERKGASVVSLDLADLPTRAQLSVTYEPGMPLEAVLRFQNAQIDLRSITAVWSRWPQPPAPDTRIASKEIRDYVKQETADTWTGVAALLDCPWVPAPRWQELRAGHKPFQLQLASELGFEIPPTLVTNCPADFLAFRRRHGGALISKTLHNKLLPVDRTDGYDAYVITELVANRELGNADAVAFCPVVFQPYVEKQVELRVTVVGNLVFPVEMHSQVTNHTRYDWRRGDHHHLQYAIHDLPPVVAQRSIELVRRLGLRFGAIDLILTPDGRYIFLEVNPNGAWLWMERTTGLPIGEAIADLLMSRDTASTQPAALPIRQITGPSGASDTRTYASARKGASSTATSLARTIEPTLNSLLRYLERIVATATPPPEALAGFRRLARRHPDIDMDLQWETENYLGGIHYDVLVRLPRGGTLSVALSPSGSLPWALRHAHHARESDLLRVNGRALNMQTVMGYLDGMWREAQLTRSLIDGCLVREAIDAHGIKASDTEVRRALLDFRRAENLDAPETLAFWLQQRGWTTSDLEYEIRRTVIARKLRARLARGQVRSFFQSHRPDFDVATIARARVEKLAAAREIVHRIKRAGAGLVQALEEALGARDAGAGTVGFETARRRDFDPSDASVIFGASPGRTVGPLKHAEGYDVVRVLRKQSARLDRPTRELIVGILFEEWLCKRRREATIEWFWGDAERTAGRHEKRALVR